MLSLQKQHVVGLSVSAMGTFGLKKKDQGVQQIYLSQLMRIIESDATLTTRREVKKAPYVSVDVQMAL